MQAIGKEIHEKVAQSMHERAIDGYDPRQDMYNIHAIYDEGEDWVEDEKAVLGDEPVVDTFELVKEAYS